MRPQDMVILLKLVSLKDKPWQFRDLSADLHISISEISASLKRSQLAGLYNEVSRSVHRLALAEFIQYGFKYVFPIRPGAMVTGIGTAHAHPFYKKIFRADIPYVWPDEEGNLRGQAIEPLHPNVPKAARKDELLYKLLASIDILRVGNVREQKLAIDAVRNALL
jgi:predicted transcriptional regulator